MNVTATVTLAREDDMIDIRSACSINRSAMGWYEPESPFVEATNDNRRGGSGRPAATVWAIPVLITTTTQITLGGQIMGNINVKLIWGGIMII
jgi:hypothetical protein